MSSFKFQLVSTHVPEDGEKSRIRMNALHPALGRFVRNVFPATLSISIEKRIGSSSKTSAELVPFTLQMIIASSNTLLTCPNPVPRPDRGSYPSPRRCTRSPCYRQKSSLGPCPLYRCRACPSSTRVFGR